VPLYQFSSKMTHKNNIQEFLRLMRSILNSVAKHTAGIYEGWNFNSGNYLFTTDTK